MIFIDNKYTARIDKHFTEDFVKEFIKTVRDTCGGCSLRKLELTLEIEEVSIAVDGVLFEDRAYSLLDGFLDDYEVRLCEIARLRNA